MKGNSIPTLSEGNPKGKKSCLPLLFACAHTGTVHLVFHSLFHSTKDQAILVDEGVFKRSLTRIDFAMASREGNAYGEDAVRFGEKRPANDLESSTWMAKLPFFVFALTSITSFARSITIEHRRGRIR